MARTLWRTAPSSAEEAVCPAPARRVRSTRPGRCRSAVSRASRLEAASPRASEETSAPGLAAPPRGPAPGSTADSGRRTTTTVTASAATSSAASAHSTRPAVRRRGRPASPRMSSRADGTGVGHGVHTRDLNADAWVLRVHDLAVADVHAHEADRAVVEHQVTGLQLGLRHGWAGAHLRAGGVREADAGLLPGPHRQTGAVEGTRAGGAEDVGLADLREGVGHRGGGATRRRAYDRRGASRRRPLRRRPLRRAARASRRPLLELVEQLRCRRGTSGGALLEGARPVGARRGVGHLADGDVLARLEVLDLLRVAGEQLGLPVV